MRIILKSFALLVTLTMFFSCKKEDDQEQLLQSPQMIASVDQTTADDLSDDLDAQVELSIQTRGGGGTCPMVTVSPTNGAYPRTITIDYGTEGCAGPAGRIRKGKIVVTLTDTITRAGAVRTVTPVNFSIDDVSIEGTRTLTNMGYDASGNVTFQRTVTGGKITFPDGQTATWEATHTLRQIAGGNTPAILNDNVFEITGSTSGTSRRGRNFTSRITVPLIKRHDCHYVVSGEKKLTVLNRTATIDFGDGTCDNKATVTLPNGRQTEILIRRWW